MEMMLGEAESPVEGTTPLLYSKSQITLPPSPIPGTHTHTHTTAAGTATTSPPQEPYRCWSGWTRLSVLPDRSQAGIGNLDSR